MKALKTKICSYAIALLVSAGFSTPTYAGSSAFAGIFVATILLSDTNNNLKNLTIWTRTNK